MVSSLTRVKIVFMLCQTVLSSHGMHEAAFTSLFYLQFVLSRLCSPFDRLSTSGFLVHRFAFRYVFGLTGELQGNGKKLKLGLVVSL